MDPSAPRHDTDNGVGNACDPGWGGAKNDNANFARFPDSSATGCNSSTVSGSSQTPPSPAPTGGVLGVSTGVGGGGESAPTGGVLGASGVGGAVAGMTGVALADTGLKSIGLALLALLLVALGVVLMRRRAAGTA